MDELRYGCRFGFRKKLAASTLVEVLVASIIFLVVFAVSLETTVRITSAGIGSGYRYAVVLAAVEAAKQEYSSGGYREGIYEEELDWGRIISELLVYEGYDNIYRLNIRAKINNDIRILEYDFLFEKQ